MNNEPISIDVLAQRVGLLGLDEIAKSWAHQGSSGRPVEVVVVGEFNHGKSSLLNALFGINVLPYGITPTTQIDTCIFFGAGERHVEAICSNQCIQSWDWNTWSAQNHASLMESLKKQSVDRIHIYLEIQPWKTDCVFMDTPGLNEAVFARESFIRKYLLYADILIFVLDANQPLTGNEQKLLTELVGRYPSNRRILVINKCDRLDDDEKLDVCNYVENTLFPAINNERFYMVSAKKKDQGDLQELIDYLNHEITYQKDNFAKYSLEKQLAEMSNILESLLVVFNQLRHSSKERLKHLVAKDSRTAVTREDVAFVIHELNHDHARMKEQIMREYELFKDEFLKAMPREIDISQIESTEKYFEDFIDEKYSEFADECIRRLSPYFEHRDRLIFDRLAHCEEMSVPAWVSFKPVEYYKKHSVPTGAFDEMNHLFSWSLPLPGVLASRVERPRREAFKKMAATAIERRASGYLEVFEESLNRWLEREISLISEHGLLLGDYIRRMSRKILADDYTLEDWME
ncbi:MAG: dynamin family protein [Proteobacteria bacterium]|nr:dynamin family protein [Pseudomonadota bacterium]